MPDHVKAKSLKKKFHKKRTALFRWFKDHNLKLSVLAK